jgi:hypothetical protein
VTIDYFELWYIVFRDQDGLWYWATARDKWSIDGIGNWCEDKEAGMKLCQEDYIEKCNGLLA